MVTALVVGGLWPGTLEARSRDRDLLARAMSAMGGADRLRRVRRVDWSGTAVVFDGDRRIDLGIETWWRPFHSAQSRSWLAAQGPTRAATMTLTPERATVDRNGATTVMPAQQARHERQQFALYGYMLLAQAPTAVVGERLYAAHAGLPPIRFDLGPDGRIARADYRVVAPDNDRTIAEQIVCEGEIASRGIRWPRRLTIAQDGKPYFELHLTRFAVTLA